MDDSMRQAIHRFQEYLQRRQDAAHTITNDPLDLRVFLAACPQPPALANRQPAVMKVKCSTQECRGCDPVTPCSRSPKPSARRTLTIRPQPHYQALQAARQREATAAFRAE
jgi:hypothetical protein